MKGSHSRRRKFTKRDRMYLLMCLPALILIFLYSVLNKFGIVLAFKDFNYVDGIWDSRWVGLANFKYIVSSGDMLRAIKNTVIYQFAVTYIGMFVQLIIAIALYMVSRKLAAKMQRIIMVPYFISMSSVAAIVYIFLRYDGGIVNAIFDVLGKEPIAWYNTTSIWPALLVAIQLWWGAGIGCIYYYSGFLAIDSSLFEAIDLDGGNWWHKIRYIMVPEIIPLLCLFGIRGMGSILASDLNLFLNVPRQSTALIPVTDVIATYEYRGLQMGSISTTAALGVAVSIVSFILLHATNTIIKKINSDNSMY